MNIFIFEDGGRLVIYKTLYEISVNNSIAEKSCVAIDLILIVFKNTSYTAL